MSDEIKDAIVENATGPKKVRGDEGEVEQHSLKDQIEADRHVTSKSAASKPARGLRFSATEPPGNTS